jgi:hypothetical protein
MVQPQLDSLVDWAEVTSLIIAGDQAAFESYYNYYFEPMLKLAKRMSGFSTEDCLDLVHDAMLKAGKCMKPIADCRSLDASGYSERVSGSTPQKNSGTQFFPAAARKLLDRESRLFGS